MWVRKRLDIGWSDLAFGVLRACLPTDRPAIQRQVETSWSDADNVLACLSVRSGFDLLLGALELPQGSEVLMSAVTIRHMVELVEQHGLVPIPVDLDIHRMAPRVDLMRRAITPATRAIVVAHLFGGRIELEPILHLAAEHGLLVIEDCAQAFAGTGYLGHPNADVSLFSFGPIKTATALGGALVRVRDRKLLQRMRAEQERWPVQARRSYLLRLLKYAALKALSSRPVYSALMCAFGTIRYDPDHFVNGTVRGFTGPRLVVLLRRQPCAPLLAVLQRRLRKYDARRLEDRASKGELLTRLLQEHVACPGAGAAGHTHWVFPILAADPRQAIALLGQSGFDATQGQSLCVVAAPADRPQLEPRAAREALAKVVFLPFYPEMPTRAIRHLPRALVGPCGELASRANGGSALSLAAPVPAIKRRAGRAGSSGRD